MEKMVKSYEKSYVMKGQILKEFLKVNGISVSEIARRTGIPQTTLSSALSSEDIRTGLLEEIAEAVGKDAPYFYGASTSTGAQAIGTGNTAVSGTGNTVNTQTDRFLDLLKEKDVQMARCQDQIDKLIGLLSK